MRYILLLFIVSIAVVAKTEKIKEFSIKQTETLGQKIYEKDLVAARGTDRLFDQKIDFRKAGILGWIVVKTGKKYIVKFIRLKKGTKEFELAYDVVFYSLKSKGEFRYLRDRKMTKKELAMFRARTTAMKSLKTACSPTVNTVVISDPESKDFLVYILTSTRTHGVIPIHGHVRIKVSSDGNKILASDKLSKNCLNVRYPKESVGVTVSNLVVETPPETYVFQNLLYKLPFYIVTKSGKMWSISSGKIKSLGDVKTK